MRTHSVEIRINGRPISQPEQPKETKSDIPPEPMKAVEKEKTKK